VHTDTTVLFDGADVVSTTLSLTELGQPLSEPYDLADEAGARTTPWRAR
jgi:hypothetical protein